MKFHFWTYIVSAGLLANSLMPIGLAHAAGEKSTAESDKTRNQAIEQEVKSEAEQKVSQQRKKILEEAMTALTETKKALKALEENNSKEALAALERASGKLNILLAREPKLALAPFDVRVTTHDVYTTVEAIQEATEQAQEYLENNEVQKARRLIRDLASEIVVSVVSIPLKTYPSAISAVAPLIDQGKMDKAKVAIQAALNTVVISDHIFPLPVARADVKLARAEALAQKNERSEQDNQNLERLLNEAREQLQLAEALGYGDKADYEIFYAEIDKIEEKTEDGGSGKGFFSELKGYLLDFKQSIFG